jgi:hypothetical protein
MCLRVRLCNACGIRAFRAKDRLYKEVSLGFKLQQSTEATSYSARTLAGTGLHQRSTDLQETHQEPHDTNNNFDNSDSNVGSGLYDYDDDYGCEEPKRSTIHHILN